MTSIAEAISMAKASARSRREVSRNELAPPAGLVMDTPTGNSESDNVHVRDLLRRRAQR